jgi:hypothetical protein
VRATNAHCVSSDLQIRAKLVSSVMRRRKGAVTARSRYRNPAGTKLAASGAQPRQQFLVVNQLKIRRGSESKWKSRGFYLRATSSTSA